MVNPIASGVSLQIVADAEEAKRKGYDWTKTDVRPVELAKVICVRNGTRNGHSTYDFLLKDKDGKEYVFMITRTLLNMIAATGI